MGRRGEWKKQAGEEFMERMRDNAAQSQGEIVEERSREREAGLISGERERDVNAQHVSHKRRVFWTLIKRRFLDPN
ncbi:hypothetical protein Bca4012_043725 [Brassica carinata]